MKFKNLPIPAPAESKKRKPVTYWVVTQAYDDVDVFDTSVDWFIAKPTPEEMAEITEDGWVTISIVEVTL